MCVGREAKWLSSTCPAAWPAAREPLRRGPTSAPEPKPRSGRGGTSLHLSRPRGPATCVSSRGHNLSTAPLERPGYWGPTGPVAVEPGALLRPTRLLGLTRGSGCAGPLATTRAGYPLRAAPNPVTVMWGRSGRSQPGERGPGGQQQAVPGQQRQDAGQTPATCRQVPKGRSPRVWGWASAPSRSSQQHNGAGRSPRAATPHSSKQPLFQEDESGWRLRPLVPVATGRRPVARAAWSGVTVLHSGRNSRSA